jgi:hypothetical protein
MVRILRKDPIGYFSINVGGIDMPFIVKIPHESEGNRRLAGAAHAEAISILKSKGLMLFNDSMIVLSLNDRALLESLDTIDLAELEREIKSPLKAGAIRSAGRKILKGKDILLEEQKARARRESLKGCSDVRSTRSRISRLLSQSG